MENQKTELIKFVKSLLDKDLNKLPGIYFASELKIRLIGHGMSPKDADSVVCALDIDLSGLGLDYEKHQYWLDQMIEHTCTLMLKIWKVCEEKVGKEFALKTLQRYNIELK